MSDNGDHGHCWECDGDNGSHYPGCSYEGTGKRGEPIGHSGRANSKGIWITVLIALVLGAACDSLGALILLGLLFYLIFLC